MPSVKRAPEAEKPIQGRRVGGHAVKEKYGQEYFREIGRKGGKAISNRGIDYLREIGRRGGEATMRQHGTKHFSEIGRKGGQNGKGTPKVSSKKDN